MVLVLPQIEPFSFNPNGMNGGGTVKMMCSIIAGDLPIKFSWLKNGKTLTSEKDHKTQQLDDSTSILSLTNLSLNHSGNYTCLASNDAGKAELTSVLKVKGRNIF